MSEKDTNENTVDSPEDPEVDEEAGTAANDSSDELQETGKKKVEKAIYKPTCKISRQAKAPSDLSELL